MKCKELPIRTITSITFPLLNEKPFSFDSTRYGRHLISKVVVTSPPSSEAKVKNGKLFHFSLKRTKDLFTILNSSIVNYGILICYLVTIKPKVLPELNIS